MNFIRLGVMWEAGEPTKGVYNQSYIEEMVKIVRKAAEYDIYVLIDAH